MRKLTYSLALATTLAWIPAGHASATPTAALAASDCNEPVMCLFYLDNQRGPAYKLRTKDSDFKGNRFPDDTNANDTMKSFVNKSGRRYCFWRDADWHGSGGGYRVNPGEVGNFPLLWRNNVSSGRPC
jgi:hypothetical protein